MSQNTDLKHGQRISGHENARSYYQAIKHLPRNTRGEISEPHTHAGILELLDSEAGHMYYSEKDEFYVDEWSIQTPELYHRHKELGTYYTVDGMGFSGYHHLKNEDDIVTDVCPCGCKKGQYPTHIQWTVGGGECLLCREKMPGEIMMMHKFFQMP